ncbi:hypothetical protein J3F83DRAFT_752205 [Trichoderma novae-zelandiae]
MFGVLVAHLLPPGPAFAQLMKTILYHCSPSLGVLTRLVLSSSSRSPDLIRAPDSWCFPPRLPTHPAKMPQQCRVT